MKHVFWMIIFDLFYLYFCGDLLEDKACVNQDMKNLINSLVRKNVIINPKISQVMCQIDRKDLTNKYPYLDSPISINYGATISAPHMHAISLQEIYKGISKEKKQIKCLDIGSGSGYMLVALKLLFDTDFKVEIYGIEHIKELIDESKKNIAKNFKFYLLDRSIRVYELDGRQGFPEKAPFDCIHVGAASNIETVNILLKQLNTGGIMFIPVEINNYNQYIYVYKKKDDGSIEETKLMEVVYIYLLKRYIPLTSKSNQLYRDL